jgi:hypothetical protein
MNKKYIIQWKSKQNGRTGRGTKLFDRGQAEELVEELNQEYPDIEHELREATDHLSEVGAQPAEFNQEDPSLKHSASLP